MKYILLIILAGVASLAQAQNYGPSLSDATAYMASLKRQTESVARIECDFEMHKKVKMMKDINVSKGRFSYDKQQRKMTLDYTQPKGNKIVVDGDDFIVTMGGKTTELKANETPAMSQLSAMVTACMTGDFISLCDRSKVDYYADNDIFTIVITPQNKRVQRYMSEIVLRFALSDYTMSVMRMTERNGDYTEYHFTNKQIR